MAQFGEENRIFLDRSVHAGDISDGLSDERIREIVRDDYLKDSTVTIVLVGTETRRRKHVDWEIYSSMYDGVVNRKSGIVVITLPTTGGENVNAPHGESEKSLYPDIPSWTAIDRVEYEIRYPHMPDRLIDNLVEPAAKISVVPWSRINVTTLRSLVDLAYRNRANCEYDLSRRMRRANS